MRLFWFCLFILPLGLFAQENNLVNLAALDTTDHFTKVRFHYLSENYQEVVKIAPEGDRPVEDSKELTKMVAESYFELKNFEYAEYYFQKLQEYLYADAYPIVRQADCAFELSNYQQAVDLYTKAGTIDTFNNDINIMLGRSFYALGDYPMAIEILEKATIEKSEEKSIYSLLNRAHIQLGNEEASRKYLALVTGSSLVSVDDFMNAGEDLLKSKSYLEAERNFLKAVEISNDPASTNFDIGSIYYNKDNFAQAIPFYEASLAVTPNYFEANYFLANCYYQLDEPGKAIRHYNKALEIKYDDPEVCNLLGLSYMKVRNYIKAKEFFHQATLFHTNYGKAYYNLGFSYYMLEDFGQAEKVLEKALLKGMNTNANTHFLLGKTRLKIDDYDGAINAFNTVILIQPNHVPARLTLAEMYIQSGYPQNSIEHLDVVTDLKPEHERALMMKGLAQLQTKNIIEAQKVFDRVSVMYPGNASAWYNKGLILNIKESFELAKTALDNAIDIDQNFAKAYYQRSIALRGLGEGKLAKSDERSAFALDPALKDRLKGN